MTVGELNRYENNSLAINNILFAVDRNEFDRLSHLDTAHGILENFACTMRVPIKLSLCIRTLTTDNTKPLHKSMENH